MHTYQGPNIQCTVNTFIGDIAADTKGGLVQKTLNGGNDLASSTLAKLKLLKNLGRYVSTKDSSISLHAAGYHSKFEQMESGICKHLQTYFIFGQVGRQE